MSHVSDDTAQGPLIGKPAPDAILTRSDGTTASILGSRQGQKAVLVFWATWCPHCYQDLGYIYNNLAAIEQKGIKVILVDIGETKEDVQEYFYRRQMKLTSFIDVDSIMQGTYKLVGVPTLIFIDDKGIVRNVTHVFPSDFVSYFGS